MIESFVNDEFVVEIGKQFKLLKLIKIDNKNNKNGKRKNLSMLIK